MAASLEETLIWVWHQDMVEEARPSDRHRRRPEVSSAEDEPVPMTRKWIFVSKVITNSTGSSRILKQHLAGPNWHAKERRSCNFSVSDATLRLSWLEQCSPTARRPATKK
jgi:hypothetical protein